MSRMGANPLAKAQVAIECLREQVKELERKHKSLERCHDALLLQNRWLKAHRQCPSCKGVLPMEPWICSVYGMPSDYGEVDHE